MPNSYCLVSRFGRAVGSQPNLVLDYAYWGEPFVAVFARTAAAHGAVVVIGLDPTGPPVRAVAAGRQDGYLPAFASAVRVFGGPVVISFGHEMNGDWYSWGWMHTRPAVFGGYLAARYLNFGNTFAPTIAAIRGITARPILVSETAVGRAIQAAEIPDLFAGVARARLPGLIWFDQAQTGGTYAQDWR